MWLRFVAPTRSQAIGLWGQSGVSEPQDPSRPQEWMISECSRCVTTGTCHPFIPPKLSIGKIAHCMLVIHRSNRARPFHIQSSWSWHCRPKVGWLNSRNGQSVCQHPNFSRHLHLRYLNLQVLPFKQLKLSKFASKLISFLLAPTCFCLNMLKPIISAGEPIVLPRFSLAAEPPRPSPHWWQPSSCRYS